MKKIGFLSFGNWGEVPGSQTPTAADTLLQTIDLAQAVEDVGADGAFVRVHHFAPQLASPYPLLAAMAAKTSHIDLGTGVIDMRYENPLYMAEEAAATDLISGGRLQLGLSRGSPETSINGFQAFGYRDDVEHSEGHMARTKAAIFMAAIQGTPVAQANPEMTGRNGLLAIQPQAPGLHERIWWGAGTRGTAIWAAQQGYNLMSSTLLTEDTGVPFHELQREQLDQYCEEWAKHNHGFSPHTSVSRSIFPITTDEDRKYFGRRQDRDHEEVGWIDNRISRFGKSFIGVPEQIAKELAEDSAVAASDTLLLTIPNQLGVTYNMHLIESVVKDVAPLLGWR